MSNLEKTKPFILALHIAIISLFAAAVGVLVWWLGPAFSHSFATNYAWSEDFFEQFQHGRLYPRWSMGEFGGVGAPVFYFYAPFPFYLYSTLKLIFCADCSYAEVSALSLSFTLLMSGGSFYSFARQFAGNWASLIAALLYLCMPYHLMIDWVMRGALGEFAAYIWMPLILYGIAKYRERLAYVGFAGIAYAGLIYSHLPSTLLFSPVMLAFALLRERSLKGALRLCGVVALGFCLSAPYLIPALTMQKYIYSEGWWALDYFKPENWLWFTEHRHPTFLQHVFSAFLYPSVVLVLSLFLLSTAERRSDRPVLYLVVTIAVYVWFMTSAPSALLWQNLPPMQKVQFPWRLGILLDLSIAMAFAMAITTVLSDTPRTIVARVLLVPVAFALVIAVYVLTAGPIGSSLAAFNPAGFKKYAAVADVRLSALEYLPRWAAQSLPEEERLTLILGAKERYNFSVMMSRRPKIEILNGSARSEAIAWNQMETVFRIEAASETRLRIRRFYFPYLSLTDESSAFDFEVSPSSKFGLIETTVPPGIWTLQLRSTLSLAEIVGWSAFIIGLAGVALLTWFGLYGSRAHVQSQRGGKSSIAPRSSQTPTASRRSSTIPR